MLEILIEAVFPWFQEVRSPWVWNWRLSSVILRTLSMPRSRPISIQWVYSRPLDTFIPYLDNLNRCLIFVVRLSRARPLSWTGFHLRDRMVQLPLIWSTMRRWKIAYRWTIPNCSVWWKVALQCVVNREKAVFFPFRSLAIGGVCGQHTSESHHNHSLLPIE